MTFGQGPIKELIVMSGSPQDDNLKNTESEPVDAAAEKRELELEKRELELERRRLELERKELELEKKEAKYDTKAPESKKEEAADEKEESKNDASIESSGAGEKDYDQQDTYRPFMYKVGLRLGAALRFMGRAARWLVVKPATLVGRAGAAIGRGVMNTNWTGSREDARDAIISAREKAAQEAEKDAREAKEYARRKQEQANKAKEDAAKQRAKATKNPKDSAAVAHAFQEEAMAARVQREANSAMQDATKAQAKADRANLVVLRTLESFRADGKEAKQGQAAQNQAQPAQPGNQQAAGEANKQQEQKAKQQAAGQADRQTAQQANRQAAGQADRQMEQQANQQSAGQENRQTEQQAKTQPDASVVMQADGADKEQTAPKPIPVREHEETQPSFEELINRQSAPQPEMAPMQPEEMAKGQPAAHEGQEMKKDEKAPKEMNFDEFAEMEQDNPVLSKKDSEKAHNPQIVEISFEDLQIFVGIKHKEEPAVKLQGEAPVKQREVLKLG